MPLMQAYTGNISLPQTNLSATPSTTTPGTTVTGSGSAHTKGSWSQIVASTNFDSYGVIIVPANTTDPSVLSNVLFDLGTGAAASEVVLMANWQLTSATNIVGSNDICFFPLFIPKGTRVAARLQSNVTSQTGNIACTFLGGGSLPPWQLYQGTETIGADTSTSTFQAHTAGNSGSYSTYTNLGSTTTQGWKAMRVLVQQGSDTTMSNGLYYIRIGIGGNTLFTVMAGAGASENIAVLSMPFPYPIRIASGTQFEVQATHSGTADTDIGIALMGFF